MPAIPSRADQQEAGLGGGRTGTPPVELQGQGVRRGRGRRGRGSGRGRGTTTAPEDDLG